MRKVGGIVFILSIFLVAAGPASDARQKAVDAKLDELKPGLGEIMGVILPHHAKLYYALNAANWDLAAYEADEIAESLDDVMKDYPHFKEVKTPLTTLVPNFTKAPLKHLEAALKKRDKPDALAAFGELTAGCNGCHMAAEHAFIVIQAPQGNEYSNQKFTP